MATDLKVDMNAQGYGPQDMRDPDGGNNSRGMLDQVRPTGIMATGGPRKLVRGEGTRTRVNRAGRGRK